MDFWERDLYQYDTSFDLRSDFEEKLENGISGEKITSDLLVEYECILKDPNIAPLFWISLADTQWDFGLLMPFVKEKALYWISRCLSDYSSESEEFLRKMLVELQNKIQSQPPQPKKLKKKKNKLYACDWNIGDTFAYQMESDIAKELGLFGKYLIVRKADEGFWHPGHIVPIVYVKITKDQKLPTNTEEYNDLEYIQTCFTKYEDRFYPIDGRRRKEDIAEKSKLNYEVDDYGLLPHFRITLVSESLKDIPSKLFMIGNFSDATSPSREFIPHAKVNIDVVFWKLHGVDFEEAMLTRYCNHNLRKLKIYSEKQ